MAGLLVILAFAAVLGGVTLWRWLAFRARWRIELVPGVPLLETAPLAPLERLRLRLAAEALRALIRAHWPDRPELLRFAVETTLPGGQHSPSTPDGRTADGKLVGGTVRSERALPWTRPIWVCVLANERAWTFLLHELSRHVLSEQLYGEPDPAHVRAELADVEARAVASLAWIRRVADEADVPKTRA